jgi:lipid-A-disaccharide synthase
MIVGYRLSGFSYALARLLVTVPHVALVNLIAGRRLMPELIQSEFQAKNLAQVTEQMLTESGQEYREGLAGVRRRLGSPGASRRAAEAVREHLGSETAHAAISSETESR